MAKPNELLMTVTVNDAVLARLAVLEAREAQTREVLRLMCDVLNRPHGYDDDDINEVLDALDAPLPAVTAS